MYDRLHYNIYYIMFGYRGREVRYKVYMYHIEKATQYWFIYGNNGTQEFSFQLETGQLQQVLLPGQKPLPDDFLKAVEKEIRSINAH